MEKLRKWGEEWKIALEGVVLATKQWQFDVVAIASFLIFGVLMNLLASGPAGFSLLMAADWGGKFQVLGSAFLSLFGVGRNFWDFLLILIISLLQGILIGLVVLVWKKRKDNADNLQRTGIVAGLAVLGSGCPTCGTTLLGPLIGAVIGSSSVALAGAISGVLTALSIILALFALKKLGFESYAIIMDEKYRRKHARKDS